MQMEPKRTTPNPRNTIDDRVVFLREFLRHPRQIGSITPSSRFLVRRIVELAGVGSARTVVELGAGTGGTSRAMLAAMAREARLLIVEINPRFCALLRHMGDPRLIVHCGGARELPDALAHYGLPAPEAVVSGIPFSTIDPAAGSQILEAIASALAPGGRFVAYQWSSQVRDLSRPLLGPAHVEMAPFNLPPLRLYRWVKGANGTPALR